MVDKDNVGIPIFPDFDLDIKPYSETFDSIHECPRCGEKLKYQLQGFKKKDNFPEIARVIIACKTCKIQIYNNQRF